MYEKAFNLLVAVTFVRLLKARVIFCGGQSLALSSSERSVLRRLPTLDCHKLSHVIKV
jgi:hypothetical protein